MLLGLLFLSAAPPLAFAAEPSPDWHPMQTWLGVYPFVELELEGVRGHALLDTGASLTVVDDDYAKRAGLRSRGRVTVRGTGGRERGRRAKEVSLTLCGRRVSNLSPALIDLQRVEDRFGRPIDAIIGGDVYAEVVPDLDYPNERVALPLGRIEVRIPRKGRSRKESAGLLGGGTLARFRVVFDLSGDEMLLVGKPNHGVAHRDRLGLQAEWKRRSLRVLHVPEDSPAERAGWREGERILSIEGKTPTPETWRELLFQTVSQPAGTRVVLTPAQGAPRASVLDDLAAWGDRTDLE